MAFRISCTDNNVIDIKPAAGLLKLGMSATINLSSGPFSVPPAAQKVYIF